MGLPKLAHSVKLWVLIVKKFSPVRGDRKIHSEQYENRNIFATKHFWLP